MLVSETEANWAATANHSKVDPKYRCPNSIMLNVYDTSKHFDERTTKVTRDLLDSKCTIVERIYMDMFPGMVMELISSNALPCIKNATSILFG